MCGIAGIVAFNMVGQLHMINLSRATLALSKRGPDYQGLFTHERVGLGHRRLSIIDVSASAHQPMEDESERYTVVFNGEIFNFQEIRERLIAEGQVFRTQSDTEVLLYSYIRHGEKCLEWFNGFFAFAIYDKQENELFIARDRMGIKPLLYVHDEDKFMFASEMKALKGFGFDKSLDKASILQYLQLTYIPAPFTVFKAVKKLMPGHYVRIKNKEVKFSRYYTIPYDKKAPLQASYEAKQKLLVDTLEGAVQRRLVADVPLGSFLSGGIDSSVITGLAARHVDKMHTFSVGYRDEPFYDETRYAELVAKKFRTEHTVFKLSNTDLYTHLHDILDYIDEPFADSSAIPVYILSQRTRQQVTVALSGDGADELFAGYNKHAALFRASQPSMMNSLLSLGGRFIPDSGSRGGAFSNALRQAKRYANGLQKSPKERYRLWASFTPVAEAVQWLSPQFFGAEDAHEEAYRWYALTREISEDSTINDYLYTDCQLVLPNDMLTKVDLMSMANSLEVRVPFLDKEVVALAFSLEESDKITKGIKKRIVQDAFREMLPAELYKRPKHGFEVPLMKWFQNELRSVILDDLLNDDFIEAQGIFQAQAIRKLKKQLFSSQPGDIQALVWSLIVFQWWWKKHMGDSVSEG
ncbi:asparagine synthase (glutamine-hydrolyzing) [Cytophagales bacterium LB-30]|uniref:asparagine synthase (glutamine-hydrolyzing) n=1 Tax=Shiella aurantiaca TaxID=3058365 RepID=A0ABT8F2Q4_9BACT|nr:asparagine synthase (glutamine-hydrolyzing) [Shiella aurantiaca]MDN4164728.1 asparagine synthase (glutamine-hydrolyzing) [Shiella aurantiaca]